MNIALRWTVEDVKCWLQHTMGMDSEITDLFEVKAVDGPALLVLDNPRLKEYGVTSVMLRKTLIMGIEALRKGNPPVLAKLAGHLDVELSRCSSDSECMTKPNTIPQFRAPLSTDSSSPLGRRTSNALAPLNVPSRSPMRPIRVEGGPLSQTQLLALEKEMQRRQTDLDRQAADLERQRAEFEKDQERWRRSHPPGSPTCTSPKAATGSLPPPRYSISSNVLVVDDVGVRTDKIQSLLRRLSPTVDCNVYASTTDDSGGAVSILTRDLLQRKGSQVNGTAGGPPGAAQVVARGVLEIIGQHWQQFRDNSFDRMRLDKGRTFLNLVLSLCGHVCPILTQDSLNIAIESPVYVMGDIHGKFGDLSFFLDKLIPFSDLNYTCNKFLFLGDYVDRGLGSLQVAAYLLALKVISPRTIFLLRGNHEMWTVNGSVEQYGETSLRACCARMFGDHDGCKVWEGLNEAFALLPLCAVVDRAVFCVHGGVPRYGGGPDRRLEALEDPEFPRFYTVEAKEDDRPDLKLYKRLATEFMWNDPSEAEASLDEYGFGPSPRGPNAACFGLKAIETFLANHNLQFIIRAHEMKQEGLRVSKSAQVITVFTSSNYCGADNGSAAVFIADGRLRFISHLPVLKDPPSPSNGNRYYGAECEGSPKHKDSGTLSPVRVNPVLPLAYSPASPHRRGILSTKKA